ncbi:MAG: hypothetical protein ACPGXZ_09215 [Saprospiraceae bacterium]
MSVFKNIRSIFVVEEPTGANESTSKKQKPTIKNKVQKPTPKPISRPSANIPKGNTNKGEVKEKFLNILFKAMEDNNIDGFDYLEFKQSIKSLSAMPMDEETRFKSAYAMATTMGATSDYLIKTAQHYVDVLQKEEDKFENAMKQQVSGKIGQQQQQIEGMEKLVAEKAAQIKKLTEDITQTQQKIEKSKASISDATSKISATKHNFIASYNLLRSQIESDVNNMKKYLLTNNNQKPNNETTKK